MKRIIGYSYPFQGSQYKEDTGVNALVKDLRQISTGFLLVIYASATVDALEETYLRWWGKAT